MIRAGSASLVLLVLILATGFSTPVLVMAAEAPAAGKFLVASRDLRDPNFAKTVVLLVDYSDQGALGVIINRPLARGLDEVLPEVDGLQDRDDHLWLGGPVAQWQLVFLARLPRLPAGARPVVDDVVFSTSRGLLEEMLEQEREFRVYAGYAGWIGGQLESEIERGGWHIQPGDPEMIFAQSPFDLWPELIQRSSVRWATSESATDLATITSAAGR